MNHRTLTLMTDTRYVIKLPGGFEHLVVEVIPNEARPQRHSVRMAWHRAGEEFPEWEERFSAAFPPA